MSAALMVHRTGPGVTVQDQGRPGYLALGLSRGGAADRLALSEGAALLGQSDTCAVLEMAGIGGEFEATIQVLSKVIVTDLGPFLPGSVALALLDVIEGLRMEVISEQKDTGDQSA